MDRVFVSARRGSPKKGTLKQLFKGNTDRPSSPVSDTATDYFPYAGGDGVDVHEFQPSHLSYEPAESMIESDVPIEAKEPQFSRKLKRVLLRGSRYEVYEPVPEVDLAAESVPAQEAGLGIIDGTPDDGKARRIPYMSQSVPSALNPLHSVDTPRDLSESGDLGEFWTLEWLNNVPTSVQTAIPVIRSLSRKSVVLVPVDSIAEYIDGIEPVVAGIELFIFMLISDQLAKLVRIICRPAVWLTSLIVGFL